MVWDESFCNLPEPPLTDDEAQSLLKSAGIEVTTKAKETIAKYNLADMIKQVFWEDYDYFITREKTKKERRKTKDWLKKKFKAIDKSGLTKDTLDEKLLQYLYENDASLELTKELVKVHILHAINFIASPSGHRNRPALISYVKTIGLLYSDLTQKSWVYNTQDKIKTGTKADLCKEFITQSLELLSNRCQDESDKTFAPKTELELLPDDTLKRGAYYFQCLEYKKDEDTGDYHMDVDTLWRKSIQKK